ncbi:MAG: hypothetical protein IJ943_09350 [Akkermansia sp.]|nr:hypothetical protein [Akkermansia sp.]
MKDRELTDAEILGESPLATQALPCVATSLPISSLARAIMRNLPQWSIFLSNGMLCTIEISEVLTADGVRRLRPELREMTPERFVTWVERFMCFSKTGLPGDSDSLSTQHAGKILASDIAREYAGRLRGVVPVRLPVWRTDPATGSRTIRLAPEGYDPETQIYTCNLLPYDEKFAPTPAACMRAMQKLLGDFPWADITDGSRTFAASREVSCFVTYMVGQYCRLLMGRQPIIIINANQPGSGKTLLAAMGLAPMHGAPTIISAPKEENEINKTLFSALAGGANYALLDDIPNLTSNYINQYGTAPSITGRLLGSNNMLHVENTMQLIATGNNLITTPDVERRTVIIDLFCPWEATEKRHEQTLTMNSINQPRWRAEMLALLWCWVRRWAEDGMPAYYKGEQKASFEHYVTIAGNIARHAGFAHAWEKRSTTGAGGDTAGAAVQTVIREAASLACDDWPENAGHNSATYTVQELLCIAENLGIADLVTSAKDRDKGRGLGIRLARYKGRYFTDRYGRAFEFGRRRDQDRTRYLITFFSPDAPPVGNN